MFSVEWRVVIGTCDVAQLDVCYCMNLRRIHVWWRLWCSTEEVGGKLVQRQVTFSDSGTAVCSRRRHSTDRQSTVTRSAYYMASVCLSVLRYQVYVSWGWKNWCILYVYWWDVDMMLTLCHYRQPDDRRVLQTSFISCQQRNEQQSQQEEIRSANRCTTRFKTSFVNYAIDHYLWFTVVL